MTLLKKQFLAFHYKNQVLWYWIDTYALERKHQGFENYVIAGVIERARWHTDIPAEHRRGDDYKINNNYRAFYARLWHLVHPKFDGFFHTRHIPDDDLPDCNDYRQLAPEDEPIKPRRGRKKVDRRDSFMPPGSP